MDTSNALIFEHPDSPRISKAAARAARRAEKASKLLPVTDRLLPKTPTQRTYLDILRRSESVFGVGPAGTGKTYMASRVGARYLVEGRIEKLIICRVTVADPRHALGFLPGKLDQKLGPWVVPILEAVKAEVGGAQVEKWKQEGKLEIASFEHMRGRSFQNCLLICDEAQNADFKSLKLLLTRVGEDCQVVITGDLDQIDIKDSGLFKIMDMASRHNVPMATVCFGEDDVVRSAFCKAWVVAFKAEEKAVTVAESEPSDRNLDQLPAFIHNTRTVTKPA